MTLTARKVETAKAGRYTDGRGLMLVVKTSGARSWVLRYQVDGRRRDMGLGPWPEVTLAMARERALDARRTCLGRGARSLRRKAQSEDPAIPGGRGRPDRGKAQRLEKREARGPMVLDAVAIRLSASGRHGGPGHHNRACAGRSQTDLGDKAGDGEPCAQADRSRARLCDGDRGAVCGGVGARALAFTILNASRSGEVRNARWSEIDCDARVWTVPAARMKGGKQHRIPLSEAAVAQLGRRGEADDLVFPSTTSRAKPMSDMTLSAVLRRMGRRDITVHGFRSSFRDWAGEATHFPREVIEAALAHRLKDKAEAAYARGDLFDKRRALMAAWAGFLGAGGTSRTDRRIDLTVG